MGDLLPSNLSALARDAKDATPTGLHDEVTALIGRTLRGPLNTPIAVDSYARFRRIFGGRWDRSLVPEAVAQYFDNGGQRAVVVRVARDARAPTLDLPAGDEVLRLGARDPGRHECVRAAVDYDGIDDGTGARFNLTVQRVRGFRSEDVLAQEIFTDVGLTEDGPRYLPEALRRSRIVRVLALSDARPEPTLRRIDGEMQCYRYANLDGDDGTALTDADLLGDSGTRSGLFALTRDTFFTQLYLPPLDPERDVGVPVLRAAARLCTRRDALLICDARREWRSVADARYGVERLSLRSPNAALYFPRYWSGDGQASRLLPPGAAAAGVLARISREQGPDAAPAGRRAAIRNVRALAVRTSEAQSYELAQLGVNCLRRGPAGRRVIWDARTLVDREAVDRQSLRVRRFALFLARGIRHALERDDGGPGIDRGQIAARVERLLHAQFVAGRLRGGTPASAYYVRCERDGAPEGGSTPLKIVFGFAPLAPGRFVEHSVRVRIAGAEAPAHA